MKRPCFALTLLLASLAGSLLAAGSAKCQTDQTSAPGDSWYGEACPLAPSESSGSIGIGHDEDARWQAHQAEESLEYLRNYDQPTPADATAQEPTPAQLPAYEAPVEAPVDTTEEAAAETPVEAPVEAPAEAPAEAAVEASVEAPVEAPVEAAVEAPVEAPVESTVEAPVATEPAPVAEPTPATESTPANDSGYDYDYRSDYDASYDREVYRPEANQIPAEVAPAVESTVEALDPYWYENTYWNGVETPASTSDELDPYWTENYYWNGIETADATTSDELDPYWIENYYWSGVETVADTNDELDPYWNENKYWTGSETPAINEVDDSNSENNNEPALAEQSTQPDTATIDAEWTKGAVESIEAWIEKLNATDEAAHSATDVPAAPVETPVEPSVEKPADNTDSTYGAHLWDDCEMEHCTRRNCEYPLPQVSNYHAEPAPAVEHVVTPAEQRDALLHVARSLNEVGLALQTASQSLVRIADEAAVEQAPVQYGLEEYPD